MNYQTDKSMSTGGNLNVGGRLRAGGSAVFTRNVRIEGWLDAPNFKSPCQGLFDSVAALREACPEPQPGWWALIGDTLPADVWRADGGEWTPTGETGGESSLWLDKLETDVEGLRDDVLEVKEQIEEVPVAVADNAPEADLAIVDEDGNEIVEFADGNIRTRNFDSGSAPRAVGIDGYDFAIADEDGNIIFAVAGGHIFTGNFRSDNISYSTSSGSGGLLAGNNEISMLFLGNSYSRDAVGYVPFLLKGMCPEIAFKFGILYVGGCTLQQHYNYLNSGPYTFDYISSEDTSWHSTGGRSFLNGLNSHTWDIVMFQQQSSNSRDYSSYQPYLDSLINYVYANAAKVPKLGWLMTPAYPTGYSALGSDTSDSMFGKICEAVRHVMSETTIDFMIPAGTAIQNARTNETLAALGNFGNLSYEGLHLQEGLPCQIEAYTILIRIFELLGLNKSVFDDNTIIDSGWLSGKNIPEPNGSPVGSTPVNIRLAQIAATMAIKKPYSITNI